MSGFDIGFFTGGGGGGGGGTYHQLHTLRLMEDFFFVGGEEGKHIDCIIAYDVCE